MVSVPSRVPGLLGYAPMDAGLREAKRTCQSLAIGEKPRASESDASQLHGERLAYETGRGLSVPATKIGPDPRSCTEFSWSSARRLQAKFSLIGKVAWAPGIAPSRGVLETLQVPRPSAHMGRKWCANRAERAVRGAAHRRCGAKPRVSESDTSQLHPPSLGEAERRRGMPGLPGWKPDVLAVNTTRADGPHAAKVNVPDLMRSVNKFQMECLDPAQPPSVGVTDSTMEPLLNHSREELFEF